MPTKPSVPPLRPDIPRRGTDMIPGAGPRRSEPSSASEGKKLIVGRDISLNGNISACEKLVVEGSVEADLSDAVAIEVSETGTYRGTVDVEEADIAGVFEGNLTVHKVLTVRPTGRLQGTIRYARLIVEAGGEINGTVETLAQQAKGARTLGGGSDQS
ncbi:polymer-forming cytoskeletal protein [Telmatospirillum sp. J64-1]|uniref:bactofilin family protein n=1 Tax=Telmatospirillum sp. J64-1 TaxID=2502183 RepID=UPI00163DD04F|nr:polymer-forming cytoskeletal protein [Telmatospirillum sp. J64-1]